jgi:tetratricopeptide (TPR) repeat protein
MPVQRQVDTMEAYIAHLRQISVAARPRSSQTQTLEATDPALAEALVALQVSADAAAHVRVADAYRRAGVTSEAHRYYSQAVALDHRNAAAYDGLARVWRDWGSPSLGLADAFRAVYYAPASAEAHNTLGTLLHAVGRASEAARMFERATALEPAAAWAWTNRCYMSFHLSFFSTAIEQCLRALVIDPGLSAARNNLALTFAASGDLHASGREFAVDGEAARQFNMGIVHSARREYARAAVFFAAAHALRPSWRLAADRAAQARRLSHSGPEYHP